MKHRTPETFQQYVRGLLFNGYDAVAIEEKDVCGCVLYRLNEIHIALKRPLSRKAAREIMAPIFSKFDHAVTLVDAANGAGCKFVERVGFKKLFEDGGFIRYALLEKDFRFRRRNA